MFSDKLMDPCSFLCVTQRPEMVGCADVNAVYVVESDNIFYLLVTGFKFRCFEISKAEAYFSDLVV